MESIYSQESKLSRKVSEMLYLPNYPIREGV